MNRRLYFGPRELSPKAVISCWHQITKLQEILQSCGTGNMERMKETIDKLSAEAPSVMSWSWDELQKFEQIDYHSWKDDILRNWGRGEAGDVFFDMRGLDFPFKLIYYPSRNTRLSAALKRAEMLGYMDQLSMFVLYEGTLT